MKEEDSPLLIRRYRDEDKQAIGFLYSQVFRQTCPARVRAPMGLAVPEQPRVRSRGAAHVGGRPGRSRGRLPRVVSSPIKVLEEETVLRLPCDLMVSAEVRGLGVGKRLILEYIANEDLIVNALGYTPAAAGLYRRLGYRAVDAEPLRLRPRNRDPYSVDLLERRLGEGGLSGLALRIAGLMGAILTPGLRLTNMLATPDRTGGFEVRRCTRAGDDFDELWRRVSPAFPIAAVRDRRWVQWRFLDDPCFDDRLFCAFDEHEVMCGYVAVRASTKRGVRIGRILDMFCDPASAPLVESLLAAGSRQLESAGVDLITCLGHLPGFHQAISKYCYLTPKRLQKPALLIWKGDEGLAEKIYDPRLWHLTHADGDDGFSP